MNFNIACDSRIPMIWESILFLFSSESHCATRSYSVRSSQVLVGLCQIPTNINSPEKGTNSSWGKPFKGVFIEMLVRSLDSLIQSCWASPCFFFSQQVAISENILVGISGGGLFYTTSLRILSMTFNSEDGLRTLSMFTNNFDLKGQFWVTVSDIWKWWEHFWWG